MSTIFNVLKKLGIIDLILDSSIQYVQDSSIQYVQDSILQYVQKYLPLLIIIAIPAIIWACVNCFFGYRFFRIILVIQGVLTGTLVGGFVIGLMSSLETRGIIFGAIIGAVIGGLINWYLHMLGVFLQSFGVGLLCGMSIMSFITSGNIIVALITGLILGVVAGVLSCCYLVPAFIVTTSIKGATIMGVCLPGLIMILSKNIDIYMPLNIIVTIIFVGLGMYFQYTQGKEMGIFSFISQQPMQSQQQAMPVQQTSVEGSMNRICQIIGVEGMYKGFEFDIDNDTIFGRDADQCNIVFPKETNGISKVQCQVTINPERTTAFIVDNHSTYGTQVNGEKLIYGKMKPLNNGDIIHFGDNNIFRVQY